MIRCCIYITTVVQYNFFTQRQSYACTREGLPVVEPLKDDEELKPSLFQPTLI